VEGFDGAALRRLRVLALLTQDELAERAGISPGLVSHMEQNRRRPGAGLLYRLAEVLGTGPAGLLGQGFAVPPPAGGTFPRSQDGPAGADVGSPLCAHPDPSRKEAGQP
jgi:transcriptional regulator with XRE-family HTH domain